MTNLEQARELLDKATIIGKSLAAVLKQHEDTGNELPDLNLDECKQLALVVKFSLGNICEAFKVDPPPPGWRY